MMKKKMVLALVVIVAVIGLAAAEREQLNDGEPHGDPPY